MFQKSERSSFKYWFAHWCAFQMTALNCRCWKLKYLFHDIEKPWLMLLWKDYQRVQTWHRTHNSHHLEYAGDKDWDAMTIDWECCSVSKRQCPLNCREEMERILQEYKWKNYESEIREHLEPLLNKYML